MITGSNTNVRHGGRLFHVQTEDSGRTNPHVITHLYFEGTILASERRDYAERVGAPDLVARVRALIEEQHEAMLARLRRGDFDAVIAERLDPVPAASPPATVAAAPAQAFGEGSVPSKPLDEVILDYLIEKSRERTRGTAPRGTRSEG
jgi:hypothetical protein